MQSLLLGGVDPRSPIHAAGLCPPETRQGGTWGGVCIIPFIQSPWTSACLGHRMLIWPAWPHTQHTGGPWRGWMLLCSGTAGICSVYSAAHAVFSWPGPSCTTVLTTRLPPAWSLSKASSSASCRMWGCVSCVWMHSSLGVMAQMNWFLDSLFCTSEGTWAYDFLARVSVSLANTRSSSPDCLCLLNSSERRAPGWLHCPNLCCRAPIKAP